ncbi:GH39 family glycosyl hydrolase [Filimonas effusa]|uniref:Beta-xylosidase n=1 Tax=Filimonas effusa TaxID=2508721 RepID=A0A4Q1D8R7_9BACT|nr:beta-xylosidase [Filimonas effusa]RXK85754.1 beta-xylosidase [Filimonas effusa]
MTSIFLKKLPGVCLLIALCSINTSYAQSPVINVDLKQELALMKPVWAWFGYDEPNYTYMKDGRKLLSEIAELSPVPVYVRTHSLLVSGNGEAALKWGSTNIYTETPDGHPVYNWSIVDSIFDTYIHRSMKPLVQIGFMPEALSTNPSPYRHYWKPGDRYSDIITGWAYPPKDYNKWRDLIYEWGKHCVERYGKEEVESWYWEVWNEPNGYYWKGTQEDFFKLYDYAADGLKKALPAARIGGINVAATSGKTGTEWTRNFIQHCISGTNYATGNRGAPMEAILFHAKGSPKVVNGAVRMNMATQLRDIKAGFEIVMSYPETQNLPVIIGESDPEGCAACGMVTNPENAYRNGTMYSSYTAASFARKYQLEDLTGANFTGAVSWSFEFENQPWFYGFRDLATNGVDKPVLNVFRMFGMMKGKRVNALSNRMYPLEEVLQSSMHKTQSDIGALASKDTLSAAVMIWNYHDDEIAGPAEKVDLKLEHIPAGNVAVSIYLIDKTHSNSYEVWKGMGSPQQPTTKQIKTLEESGKLRRVDRKKLKTNSGKLELQLLLERQAVALVTLDWQ